MTFTQTLTFIHLQQHYDVRNSMYFLHLQFTVLKLGLADALHHEATILERPRKTLACIAQDSATFIIQRHLPECS